MTASAGVRVAVHPGDGVVARTGAGVLLALPGGTGAMLDAILDAFQQACSTAEMPGRRLARTLVGLLVQSEPEAVPPFGALAPTEAGWAVILHGAVTVDVSGEQPLRFSGSDAATWVDRIIDQSFTAVRLAGAGTEAREIASRLDLHSGIVPGQGVVMLAHEAAGSSLPAASPPERQEEQSPAQPQAQPPPEPVPAAAETPQPQPPPPPPPAPSHEPAHEQSTLIPLRPEQVAAAAPSAPPAQPAAPPPATTESPSEFESVVLVDVSDVPVRDPLPILGGEVTDDTTGDAALGPMVDGILCERNHFNHPLALYCSSCGVSTVHRTRATVKGPRPSLGVVVGDDGTTFTLDTDYVVGREPLRDPAVKSGAKRPLDLQDPERSLSRVHAEIRLVDWDVVIVDRSSANGTFVAARDAQEWARLVPEQPHTILPGTRIAFGRRIMTYDTHHQA